VVGIGIDDTFEVNHLGADLFEFTLELLDACCFSFYDVPE
jgi:hypothetical protein